MLIQAEIGQNWLVLGAMKGLGLSKGKAEDWLRGLDVGRASIRAFLLDSELSQTAIDDLLDEDADLEALRECIIKLRESQALLMYESRFSGLNYRDFRPMRQMVVTPPPSK